LLPGVESAAGVTFALDVRSVIEHGPLLHSPGGLVYLVRDIMYCKPGKVRPLLDKFKAMAKLGDKMGWGKMRLLTDVCAERYWTLVTEFEVPDLKTFEDMNAMQGSPEDMKEMERLMSGYHDLVDHGKREIYRIEL
jgi:hypothetical protein